MFIALHMPKRIYRGLRMSMYLALGSGCASESIAPRICSACVPTDPSEGGSGVSGSQAACVLAYQKRSVDRAEAERLGFPVTATAALIEQPIDAPVTWVPKETEGGGPASGYERETRIRGALKVESYVVHQLDPARCDGATCMIDGDAVDQAPCRERYIMLHVSGEFETLDGALSLRFPAQAANLRYPGQFDDVVVAAAADLSQARGRLILDPQVPSPRTGRVDLSLQYADSQRRGYGVLGVSVVSDDRANPGPTSRAYAPIAVEWGDPPTGAAMVSPSPP